MTGNGGTGQLSGHWTTLVTAGGPPPVSQATVAAMSITLADQTGAIGCRVL